MDMVQLSRMLADPFGVWLEDQGRGGHKVLG
jgi:hypothetical protein